MTNDKVYCYACKHFILNITNDMVCYWGNKEANESIPIDCSNFDLDINMIPGTKEKGKVKFTGSLTLLTAITEPDSTTTNENEGLNE